MVELKRKAGTAGTYPYPTHSTPRPDPRTRARAARRAFASRGGQARGRCDPDYCRLHRARRGEGGIALPRGRGRDRTPGPRQARAHRLRCRGEGVSVRRNARWKHGRAEGESRVYRLPVLRLGFALARVTRKGKDRSQTHTGLPPNQQRASACPRSRSSRGRARSTTRLPEFGGPCE